MEEELAWADLVVARAGAGTLAEVAAVGRASLLIPYPHAADDHQAKNAAAYAASGAAITIAQSAADSTRLALEIGRVLRDDSLREKLAACALHEGRPDATGRIADDLLELARISKRPVARPSSPNGVSHAAGAH
jgi:UDP-N-acetylglucosamine--N-acetylmuramyl-(pentapeptide) pyrophosphoryl-undecaprenol N-acetylglucosamine transferase